MKIETLFGKKLVNIGFILTVLVVCYPNAFGQTDPQWLSISSAGDEFAASVPPEIIIINEDRGFPRLILSSYEVRFEIYRRPNNGKKDAALGIRSRASDDSKVSTFELGNVVGHVSISERPKRSATVITASSPKYIYSVAAYGRRPDHPNLRRFLASIQFGGKPLLNIPGSNLETTPAPPTKIDDLDSSPIVKEFLSKPINSKFDVRYEFLDPKVRAVKSQDDPPDYDYAEETRSLIILRMPRPAYTPLAGRRSGTVMAHVTLLSTGHVGTVVVDPRLDRGLADAAAAAARQIKFIPAEIGGKPVDIHRRFVYGFTAR